MLRTTLLTLFDCQPRKENFSFPSVRTIRCPPECLHLKDFQMWPPWILLFLEHNQVLVQSHLLGLKFAHSSVCFTNCVMPSDMTSGLLCLATQVFGQVWAWVDLFPPHSGRSLVPQLVNDPWYELHVLNVVFCSNYSFLSTVYISTAQNSASLLANGVSGFDKGFRLCKLIQQRI